MNSPRIELRFGRERPHRFKKKSNASETKIKAAAKPFAGTSAMARKTCCKAARPSVTAVSRQQPAGHLVQPVAK